MSKSKKQRQSELSPNTEDAVRDNETAQSNLKSPKDRSKAHRADAKVKKKKKEKKSKFSDNSLVSPSEAASSRGVHLDSLQSIFADKDERDGAFTLFGGEPVSNASPERLPVLSVSATLPQVISPQQTEQRVLYFFPHYDSPEKNARSLFPLTDEPFFHNRTELAPYLALS